MVTHLTDSPRTPTLTRSRSTGGFAVLEEVVVACIPVEGVHV
jgi:hypothetical protein